MKQAARRAELHAQIEARHDDLLQRLEELNHRVDHVLAEYGAADDRDGQRPVEV